VPPSQWEKMAVGLLERPGEAWHGKHEADHLVLVVDHHLQKILVHEGKILLDEVVDLSLGQGHGAVDLLERLVQQVEQFLGPAQDLLFLGILQQAKAAAFQDAVSQAQQLLGKGRHVCGHLGAEFDVVDILGETQTLDQFLVVGKIVVAGDGRKLVEALDQHALRVKIAKTLRAREGFQAQIPRPLLNGLEQGGDDFRVVGGIEPAEAKVLRPILFIGDTAVDGGDAPDRLAVLVGQELPRIGILESRVLFLIEYLHFVVDQLRHPYGNVFVQCKGQLDERLQVPFVYHFTDSDAHGHLVLEL
jgi:hypothetical protein